jgi:hypothetical protein
MDKCRGDIPGFQWKSGAKSLFPKLFTDLWSEEVYDTIAQSGRGDIQEWTGAGENI